jgi:hypothetical protein
MPLIHDYRASIIDDLKVFENSLRGATIKVKKLLKAKDTDVLVKYECYQVQEFLNTALTSIEKINQPKINQQQTTQLLKAASIDLHIAVTKTIVLQGFIHDLVCKLYADIFQLLPRGLWFEPLFFSTREVQSLTISVKSSKKKFKKTFSGTILQGEQLEIEF